MVRVRTDESVRFFHSEHMGRAWLKAEREAGRIEIRTPLTRSRADGRWYAVIRQHREAWWRRHRIALIAAAVLTTLAVGAAVLLAAWALRYWIGAGLVVVGVLALLPTGAGRLVHFSGWARIW